MEVNSSERTATAIELATVVLAIDYQLEPVQDFRLNKAQSLQLHLMTLTSPSPPPNQDIYEFQTRLNTKPYL